MHKSLILWAALILVTAFNLHYFFSRWAELPLSNVPTLLAEDETSALFMGAALGVVLLSVLDLLTRARWLRAFLLGGLAAVLLFYARKVVVFAPVLNPDWKLVAVGALLSIVCLRLRAENAPAEPRMSLKSFALYTIASLNIFLYVAPFTTFFPAYIQDAKSPEPSLAYFYYGSIHSDISMVSVFFRGIINSFFDHPSINATILTSIILVSVGLGCVALAFEMLFGRTWGWLLLLAAWTDRYVMAGGLSSSVVSMPILSSGSVFLLGVWSLIRSRGMLSWKEAVGLGLFNAVSLLYSLYSYSAARIPWIIGSLVAGVILLVRGAFPFNLSGLKRLILTFIPSIILSAYILVFIFGSDVTRFKAQLFISPKPEQIIRNVNDYPVKVHAMHDVDMPIWWGTGRPEGINVNLYWRRTPREIYDKAVWFISYFADGTPVAPYSLLVAALSLLIAASSWASLWSAFAAISAVNLLGAFAPFILAQDISAYRRALPTNLMLIVAILSMLAVRRRAGVAQLLSVGLCVGFCILKAPSELAPMFNNLLHVPLCITCHDHFNVRALVNDPVFKSVQDRNLIFVADGTDISHAYAKCLVMALDSHEMKQHSPGVQYVFVGERPLSDVFNTLKAGDVFVVTCVQDRMQDSQKRSICDRSPPFGSVVGAIGDPNRAPSSQGVRPTKWVFIRKEA